MFQIGIDVKWEPGEQAKEEGRWYWHARLYSMGHVGRKDKDGYTVCIGSSDPPEKNI